jgi:hypothetical protein
MTTELKVDLPLPIIINTYSDDIKSNIYDYLNSLDEQQQKAYKIAFTLLESSFDILKSNGYREWFNNKNS